MYRANEATTIVKNKTIRNKLLLFSKQGVLIKLEIGQPDD